jgi:hypothetical protein
VQRCSGVSICIYRLGDGRRKSNTDSIDKVLGKVLIVALEPFPFSCLNMIYGVEGLWHVTVSIKHVILAQEVRKLPLFGTELVSCKWCNSGCQLLSRMLSHIC